MVDPLRSGKPLPVSHTDTSSPAAGDNADDAPAQDGGGVKRLPFNERRIHVESWRIAIRQADMMIRMARAQADADHVGKSGRRRPGRSPWAVKLDALADRLWNELKQPPATVADAYAWDERMEDNWPGSKP